MPLAIFPLLASLGSNVVSDEPAGNPNFEAPTSQRILLVTLPNGKLDLFSFDLESEGYR